MGVYLFAKKVGMYPARVYSVIKEGKIKMDYVGKSKMPMINYERYKNYPFKKGYNYNKKNVAKWFKYWDKYTKERNRKVN